jgi:hypothetical protein
MSSIKHLASSGCPAAFAGATSACQRAVVEVDSFPVAFLGFVPESSLCVVIVGLFGRR